MHSLFCTAFAAFVVSTMLSFTGIGGERRLWPRPARLQCVRGVPLPGAQSEHDGPEPWRSFGIARLAVCRASSATRTVLKSSGIVWDDQIWTLDQWITDPQISSPATR